MYQQQAVYPQQGGGYNHPQDDVQYPLTKGGLPYKAVVDPGLPTFIKYLFFSYNLLFWLIGCSLLGVGIWMAVDRSFMSEITDDPLYAVAAYIIVAAGGITFIISFIGCCGAIMENKLMLWIFFATMGLIVLILLIAGILAIVFRSEVGEAVQETMRDTLREHYGFNLYDDHNRAITRAWDKAQEKMDCCAVSNSGWSLYRETKWFHMQPTNPEEQKPYVPKSCCVRDRFEQYINEHVCMTWMLGPPAHAEGGVNRALYYRGCYDAGVDYLIENSDIIIALAFTFGALIVLGMLLSFYLIRKIH